MKKRIVPESAPSACSHPRLKKLPGSPVFTPEAGRPRSFAKVRNVPSLINQFCRKQSLPPSPQGIGEGLERPCTPYIVLRTPVGFGPAGSGAGMLGLPAFMAGKPHR